MDNTQLVQGDKHYNDWNSLLGSVFNNNADDYDKWVDLTESLIKIFEQYNPYPESNEKWYSWKNAAIKAHAQFVDQGTPHAAQTRRKASKAGKGTISKFRIASCLIYQPALSKCNQQYLSIYALILTSLLYTGYNKKSEDFANKIRLFTENHSLRISVYSKLPVLDADLRSYCAALIFKSRELMEYLDDKQSLEFLKDIQKLADHILDSSELHKPHSKISEHQYPIEPNLDLDDESQIVRNLSTVIKVNENGEPDINVIFEESDLADENLLPTNGIKAESTLSKHWLRAHYSRTAFDKNRLTPIEKRLLARFIKDYLFSKQDLEKYTGIALALAYTTPLSIRDAINHLSKTKQLPTITNSAVRKLIVRPENAYTPPEVAKQDLLDIAEYIDLPLHPIITEAMTSVDAKPTQQSPDSEQIEEFIIAGISRLRNNGQYDISQKRINLALKIEIALNDNNPITTHILTGTDNEAPPILGYYAAPNLNHILEIYKSTIHGMLSV